LAELIRNLKVDAQRSAALARLGKAKASDAMRGEVIAGLGDVLASPHDFVRAEAVPVLANWGTDAHADLWIRLLNDRAWIVQQGALMHSGRIKHEGIATAIARNCVLPLRTRQMAVQKLKELGVAAEPAAIELLSHEDNGVRGEACHVLSDVGTERCLPALVKLFASNDEYNLERIRRTVKTICARIGKPEPNLAKG
jgi:HEAT repeat protein